MLQMSTGVVYMIQNQLTGDLASLYTLLSRVSDGTKTLFQFIHNYLLETGDILVKSDDSANNAVIYIQVVHIIFILKNCAEKCR